MLGFTPFAAAPFADLGAVSVTVAVTGVEATGFVGDVTIVAQADVFPAGIPATGEIGDVEIFITIVAEVTSVTGTGFVGDVLVAANAEVFED